MSYTLDNLQALGFDNSERDDDSGYLRVRCSCCEALVINGTPCHETGCPNQSRECRECGCLIPAGESCDCMDPIDDDSYAEFDDSREAGDEDQS